jgi:hypothetical protein
LRGFEKQKIKRCEDEKTSKISDFEFWIADFDFFLNPPDLIFKSLFLVGFFNFERGHSVDGHEIVISV